MITEYFESAEVSDVGRKRQNNEDACLRIPEQGIFCVADGMGGQAGGDLASEAITTNLYQVFTKATPEEAATLAKRIELFRTATNQASKWIKKFSDEKVIGQMGSTVVALVIDPRNPARGAGLHAGDSRLYRYRCGELKQITSDHSAIAVLAAKLGRPPESIPAKYQNELLRAVGLTEAVELEKTPVDIASGDLYLICSDGLTKMKSDEQIATILRESAKDPISTIAQKLVNAANEAGGKDNVTVVLVKACDLSNVPSVLDPSEEEDKTVAAPATPSAAEFSPTPSGSVRVPAIPDIDDIHGDTPPTPPTKDRTSEQATVAKPGSPNSTQFQDQTPTPDSISKPLPSSLEIKANKKPRIKTEAKPPTPDNPESDKIRFFPLIVLVATAFMLAAGAGIWFAGSSKAIVGGTYPPIPSKPEQLRSVAQDGTIQVKTDD